MRWLLACSWYAALLALSAAAAATDSWDRLAEASRKPPAEARSALERPAPLIPVMTTMCRPCIRHECTHKPSKSAGSTAGM